MMAPHYQSTSTAPVSTSHVNLNATSPPAVLAMLPPSRIAPFPGPAQHPSPIPAPAPAPPYTEHDVELIGRDSMTPPPPYAESTLRFINGDTKTLPHTYDSSPASLRYCSRLNKQDAGRSLYVGAPEESSSVQRLCVSYVDHDSAILHSPSPTQGRIPIYCATCTLASNHLNYNANLDTYVYRWQTTERPIPIGINLSSFESNKQRSLVTRCLKVVLQKLNDNLETVGPQFRLVKRHSSSAFVVTFEGENPHCYASAFFPDWSPRNWYINVYKPGLTLCSEQKQHLRRTKRGDTKTAQLKALEQNLIAILTHEMLHIIGIRHCAIDENVERAPYVRFPIHLSDEDNQDPSMKPNLNWEDLSNFDLKPQTVEEIRQIYAKKEGETIGPYIIRDVSWRSGVKIRRKWLESMRTMK